MIHIIRNTKSEEHMIKINKKKSRLIILCSFIAIAVCIGAVILHNNTKTKFYDTDCLGNNAGNLYNNGYFCESDHTIYFKNMADNGTLYSMDLDMNNFKKLNGDKVSYINANGPYIYYSRMNLNDKVTEVLFNVNCTGLYRCDTDGKSIKNLYTDPTGLACQYGNTVFYQHYNKKTGLSLYKVGIDGNDENKISDDAIIPGCFKDGKMYYSGVDNNHYIMSYDIKNNISSTFLNQRGMYPLICDDYLYYMDIDNNYCISRYPLKGGKPEIVVKDRCANYNLSISGKYLIYQTDASDNNHLCKLDLNTGDVTILMDGNYENINVTSNYIFFNQFKSDKTFYLENGTNIAKPFNPPVEK